MRCFSKNLSTGLVLGAYPRHVPLKACVLRPNLCCRFHWCQAGETIRQTAERTAQQVLLKTATSKGQRDDVAQLHFVGNCPAGWFWRTAKEEERPNSTYGDKVNRAFELSSCKRTDDPETLLSLRRVRKIWRGIRDRLWKLFNVLRARFNASNVGRSSGALLPLLHEIS